MSDLEYSTDAFLSRMLFYNNKIVYVEGIDDIPFWHEIFFKIGFECNIQELNGVENVKKRMPEIISDGSGCNFLAIDGDYRKYTSTEIISDFVFVTPCYGIENIMFCKNKAVQYAFKLNGLKKHAQYSAEIAEYINAFRELLFHMCCIDILNEILKKGERILDFQFARFYNKSTFFASRDVLDNVICELEKKFSAEELRIIDGFKEDFYNNFFSDVRCHFWESFFQQIIRHVTKERNISLSNDAIRASFISCVCHTPCETVQSLLDQVRNKTAKLLDA